MLTYITFGQSHTHILNGKTFDKDCVAVVDAPEEEARSIFWPKFHNSYTDKSQVDISYFPRGFINLEYPTN